MANRITDEDMADLLRQVKSNCGLSDAEAEKARCAIAYYLFVSGAEMPWGDGLTERQRTIDQAVLSTISTRYNLGTSEGIRRAPFDPARVTAARMRNSNTDKSRRRRGGPGRRGKNRSGPILYTQ